MRNKRSVLSLVILFLLITSGAFSQVRINSPYTMFGIGKVNDANVNARSFSMGGLAYGLRFHEMVNTANPAAYTAIDSMSFVFEGALQGAFSNLRTNTVDGNNNYVSLKYLNYGFQITPWWNSSFGITPFSDVGYNVAEDIVYDSIGNTRAQLEGSGGFNQVYWGNGFALGKNFSIGINAAYIFGSIDREHRIGFPDSVYMMGTLVYQRAVARDFYFTLGAQYHGKLSENLNMNIGLTFNPQTNLRARQDYEMVTYRQSDNGITYRRDTVAHDTGQEGTIVLPSRMGFGVVFENPEKWMAGADFTYQLWEDFKYFGAENQLQNSWRTSVGAEYTPDKYSVFSYLERMTYRMGVRYENSYLYVKDNQINEIGISFGVGLPLRKSKSSVNMGIEVGTRGTTDNNLIQENFVKFTLGISFHQPWFIRSKYF